MGYKDVRLRLNQMHVGQRFRCLMDKDIAKRMERVVRMNDGQVVERRQEDEDMLYTVERL